MQFLIYTSSIATLIPISGSVQLIPIFSSPLSSVLNPLTIISGPLGTKSSHSFTNFLLHVLLDRSSFAEKSCLQWLETRWVHQNKSKNLKQNLNDSKRLHSAGKCNQVIILLLTWIKCFEMKQKHVWGLLGLWLSDRGTVRCVTDGCFLAIAPELNKGFCSFVQIRNVLVLLTNRQAYPLLSFNGK